MRVIYDHQLFSLQDAGGASRYHYELLRYLAGVPDVQAELLVGITRTVYPFTKLDTPRIHITRCGGMLRPGRLRYIANETLGNCIAPFRKCFDVYHPTLYRALPAVRTRRLVVTHHDCSHERFPEMFPRASQILRDKQSLFSRADAIICVSESSRKDLLEFYRIDTAKTRVIHHGITHLPRCPAAAKKLQEQVRREYVLYVGHRAAYRLFNGLLLAFHETGLRTSVDLLVLGGGPLTPEETGMIAKLGLRESVVSITEVSDELLAEAYASAKLFVYPSLSEGFGFPPLEAMAAGCPVLVCYASSIPEVCRDAPFYFDPADQNSFSGALLQAINDEAARTKSIQRGRGVVGEYSWEKCGRQTLELYRECL